MNSRDYPKLISVSSAATRRFPKDSIAFAHLAYANVGLQKFEEALMHANTATALAGDQRFSYLVRGIANIGLHNYEEGIADCSHAISLGQKHFSVYLTRSYALASAYQYEEALADLDQVIKIDPKNANVELYRAYVLLGMNQFTAAHDACYRIFESVSADALPFALFVRALINNQLGNFDLAIADMHTAKDVMHRHEEIYINLAYFHARKGELKESQDNLDKLAEVENSFFKAYRDAHQARLLLQNKQDTEALVFSRCAATLRPFDAFVRATHGLALLRNGITNDAQVELDIAIQLDKYYCEANWFRGELYEKLGDEEKAKEDRKVATDYGYIPYL